MFRASSESAVATTAVSVDGNPHSDASSRPFWRAATTSESQSIEIRTSSAMGPNLLTVDLFPRSTPILTKGLGDLRGEASEALLAIQNNPRGHLLTFPS